MKCLTLVPAMILSFGSPLGAQTSTHQVSLSAPSGVAEDVFQIADMVSLPLTVESQSQSGLFGVELEIACNGEYLRIASPDVEVAFAATAAATHPESLQFPTESFRLVRKQAVESLNRGLGADGAAVYFATVDFEVLSDQPFETEVVIRARAVVIGATGVVTSVLDGEPSQPGGFAEGRFTIRNLGSSGIASWPGSSNRDYPIDKSVKLVPI